MNWVAIRTAIWAIISPFVRFVGIFIGIVVFIVLLKWIGGMALHWWSPDVSSSAHRLSENGKRGISFALDKRSLKSEAESGTFGKLTAKTAVYDMEGKAVWTCPEGMEVMAMDLKGQPKTEAGEGMTVVMLKNKNHHFSGGNIVQVPSRLINWL